MPASPRAFRWALGIASKETTFGVAQADGSLTNWWAVTEADMGQLDVKYRTNESEINGFVGATRASRGIAQCHDSAQAPGQP
jgi:hypothetical protein